MHRRAGLRLQGLALPPRDPSVHAAGRRLHRSERHGRQVDLRKQVRRRELHLQAQQARPVVHGQRRTQHQRLAVLSDHGCLSVARRQACGVRRGGRGHGRGQEDRVLWQSEWQDYQEDLDRQ